MTEHIIYKYTLDFEVTANIVPMPKGATILHVQAVNDQICVWARVKPDAPSVKRKLAVIGTGNPMPPSVAPGQHVGSAVLLGGRLVAHIFDLGVA